MIIKKHPIKNYLQMFGEDFLYAENDNCVVAIYPNTLDEFNATTVVNGLIIHEGNHIDMVMSELTSQVREKLIKKYKTMKPSDIKQKISLVIHIKNYPLLKFDSQTKERMINSTTEIKNFMNLDFSSLVSKLLKTPQFIDPITEVYKIKEELKRRQELKGLEKTVKKIKSDKYLPSIGVKKYLMLCEGACLEENTKVMLSDYSHKAIKDIEVGDNIISGDLSTQTVKSKVKLMKEALSIKTASGIIVCGVGHKLKALDTQTNEFIFIEASKLKEDKDRYKLLKAKINSNTNGLKVIGNDVINHILELDNGVVQYTPNDYFVVVRDEIIVRLYSEEVACGDLLILS